MPSTRSQSSRRTSLPRPFAYARKFQKDWERLTRSGRHDLARLKQVMLLLIADDAPLGAEWSDHSLKGQWANHRECHVGGDFLLIYRADEQTLVFVRIGTHSELFE